MLEAFEQFIVKNHLCNKTDKILVAVSGGIDSIVMLDLFHKAGYNIGIAHCNFKLRGEESDQDAEFVKGLTKDYKLEYHGKICDANEYIIKYKCSIQEAARELRYSWFEELCNTYKFDAVAVAQHADDQVETFFINLLRGSGVAGLKGMPVKRERIIRPLLFSNRIDIEKYAAKSKLNYREDSSNASEKYLRNQIRRQLLPQLDKIKSNYWKTIGNSLQYLLEEHYLLNDFKASKQDELFIEEDGLTKIPIDKLLNNKHLPATLFYLLKDFGYNREMTDSIVEAIRKRSVGSIFKASEYQLLVDREYLLMQYLEEKTEDDIYLIKEAGDSLKTPIVIETKIIDQFDFENLQKDPSFAYFDLDKLNFPLTIRKWKVGDRFIPFGMKGSKLISDYLVDEKVDRIRKETVYVLETEGKVAWVIGYRISDKFKLTGNTSSCLMLKLSKS